MWPSYSPFASNRPARWHPLKWECTLGSVMNLQAYVRIAVIGGRDSRNASRSRLRIEGGVLQERACVQVCQPVEIREEMGIHRIGTTSRSERSPGAGDVLNPPSDVRRSDASAPVHRGTGPASRGARGRGWRVPPRVPRPLVSSAHRAIFPIGLAAGTATPFAGSPRTSYGLTQADSRPNAPPRKQPVVAWVPLRTARTPASPSARKNKRVSVPGSAVGCLLLRPQFSCAGNAHRVSVATDGTKATTTVLLLPIHLRRGRYVVFPKPREQPCQRGHGKMAR